MKLTAKQLEVMEWILKGKANNEIAVILGVPASTINSRVHGILNRLGVPNRTAAALEWIKK